MPVLYYDQMERAGIAVVAEGGVEEGLATAELKLSEAGHPLTVKRNARFHMYFLVSQVCISWFSSSVFVPLSKYINDQKNVAKSFW